MVPWRNIRISDKAHLSLDWDFFWMFNLSTTDLTIMSCPFWIICSFHALHWHDTEYDQVTNCDWMWHVRQWQWHRVTIFLDLPNAGLLIESYHNYKSFQHDLGLWWRHKHLWNISHLELERPETELLLLFPVDIFHNFFPFREKKSCLHFFVAKSRLEVAGGVRSHELGLYTVPSVSLVKNLRRRSGRRRRRRRRRRVPSGDQPFHANIWHQHIIG